MRSSITTGGSEALQIVLECILDDGDEILIPEPFYPNYNTMVNTCRRQHPSHPHLPGGGLSLSPTARRSRSEINDAYPRHHGHEPRQPHRRCPDSGGDAHDAATSPRSTTCSSSATRHTVSSSTAGEPLSVPGRVCRRCRQSSLLSTPCPSASPPAARVSAAS